MVLGGKVAVGGQEVIYIFLQLKSDFRPKFSLNVPSSGPTAEILALESRGGSAGAGHSLNMSDGQRNFDIWLKKVGTSSQPEFWFVRMNTKLMHANQNSDSLLVHTFFNQMSKFLCPSDILSGQPLK